MNYLIILQLILLASCSFKAKDKDNKEKAFSEAYTAEELKNMDSDGDLVSDFIELEKGLDPYVADIPEISVNFLQDYNLKIIFEDESLFEVDTIIGRDDPDFKYRVGSLFQKENSLNNAARIGRFSGISWGNITQKDYSWVKYPDVDKEFYHNKVLEFSDHAVKKIKSFQINLENTLKLKNTGLFSQIEKLEVNFYYYSYEKEAHVLVHTEMIDQVFLSGVRENFTVTISNPPEELLRDSYLRRGEFLISEIKDFYIPELKTSYSKLKKSVLNKSIPVYVTNPFENSLKYVGVGESGASFSEILNRLYGEKFKIENEKLVQLEQFVNNLKEFKYLSELRELDKDGKWFVMTNKTKRHYLKHNFTKSDSITLSYITGEELSKSVGETVFSKRTDVSSEENSKTINLGNVTSNSVIELSIYPKFLTGVRLTQEKKRIRRAPGRCRSRNCSGRNWWMEADYIINRFNNFKEDYRYLSLDDVTKHTELLINNKSLNLHELIESNDADVELVEGSRQYLKIRVENLSTLDVIEVGSENLAKLKIDTLKIGAASEGVKVTEVRGKNINTQREAPAIAVGESILHKVPVSTESWLFNKWQVDIKWGMKIPQGPSRGHIISKGKTKKHFESQVIDLVSTITNYIN